jgi:dUTP pyrophosphatase
MIKVKKTHPDAIIPKRQTPGSSGFDLSSVEDVVIQPGQTKLVSTGLAFEMPLGRELQVRARSGMSLKTSLRIANGIGSIDADFRGTVQVIAWNSGDADLVIKKGERIAQGVLAYVDLTEIVEAEELDETSRGSGGFGSTGTT